MSRIKSFLFLGILFGSFSLFFSFASPKKSSANHPVTEEKAFAIIIPSYNNSAYVEKNLRSVFSQKYEKFRVIYIDDNSRDDTLEKAKSLLGQLDKKKKSTLIHNPSNLGALANIYNAVHSCHNHEIVVLLDGDDFFAHENVLNTLNRVYANPEVWLTYGNYLDYPTFKQEPKICKPIPEKIIQSRAFRKYPWMSTHLRTFYAALFKEIQIKDLFYRGGFYSMGWDLAILMPMLEMGASHIQYIDEILYLYNRENPISDHQINIAFQEECATHIRAKPKYPILKQLPGFSSYRNETADLLIFSENNPLQLYALLESVNQNVQGLNKITVLYQSSSTDLDAAYLDLKLTFPSIHLIKKTDSFKTDCQKILFEQTLPKSDYILFAKDHSLIQDKIDLPKMISALTRSRAYGFYLSHHEKLDYCSQLERHEPLPPHCPLIGLAEDHEIPFAWQFSSGVDDWNSPNTLNFALYHKKEIEKIFKELEYDSPETLVYEWEHALTHEKIGLFYSNPKSLSLKTKFSSKMLLEKFNDGFKIDLTSLTDINSPSLETTMEISFVPRE